MADVEGIDANTPIVYDDPITSLDQDFEESIVARLVALAKQRQIIVFTPPPFFHAHTLGGYQPRWQILEPVVALNREPWGTGEPGETPFSTRKPERVINGLQRTAGPVEGFQ